jgi:chromosome segregation ATPase
MKKIGLMVVAVSLSLSLAAFAGNKSAGTQNQGSQTTPAKKGKVKAAESPGAIEKELAQLKQEHQAVINELQEIRKVAAEEKATKTTAKIDQLIARHNQEYQKKVEPLQKKLDAARPKPDQPKGTSTAPKKGSPK